MWDSPTTATTNFLRFDAQSGQELADAGQKHVARGVELGQRLYIGGRGLEIGIFGLDDVEQVAAGIDEPLDQHVARPPRGDVARLDRPQLLLERVHVRPGDRRVARRFVANPRGMRIGGPRARLRLGKPRLGAAEQMLAHLDQAANVEAGRILEHAVATRIDSDADLGKPVGTRRLGLLARGIGQRPGRSATTACSSRPAIAALAADTGNWRRGRLRACGGRRRRSLGGSVPGLALESSRRKSRGGSGRRRARIDRRGIALRRDAWWTAVDRCAQLLLVGDEVSGEHRRAPGRRRHRTRWYGGDRRLSAWPRHRRRPTAAGPAAELTRLALALKSKQCSG